MSSPKVWGPALWYILHTYTERLGNQQNQILSTDQRVAWINLLKSVEGVIPCARCRAHYKEWRINSKSAYEAARKINLNKKIKSLK